MNIHTFSSWFKLATSFNATLTNATVNGTGVDTQGYRRASLVFDAVTGAATTVQVQLQDSPDNTTFTNVTNAVQPASPLAASSAGAYLIDIDLAYRQRYLRAVVTGTGTAGQATAHFLLFEAQIDAPTQVNSPVSV